MTFNFIDLSYSQESLETVLNDYRDSVNNATGGEAIQVSSTQIYIDNDFKGFFDHVYTDEDPVEVLVSDFSSVIEPGFSEDWIIRIVTTIKHE